MGVEYKHYLLPKPNSVRPTAKQVGEFVLALVAKNWVVSPGSPVLKKMKFTFSSQSKLAAKTGAYVNVAGKVQGLPAASDEWLSKNLDKEWMIVWPVESLAAAGLRYPFTQCDNPPTETYYEIQLHSSPNYVYRVSEYIEPFSEELECSCGASLEFTPKSDIFYSNRIYAVCPECETECDLSNSAANLRDIWTGEELKPVKGGATSRFALVVDCGKCIPSEEGPVPLESDLIRLFEKCLSCRAQTIMDAY